MLSLDQSHPTENAQRLGQDRELGRGDAVLLNDVLNSPVSDMVRNHLTAQINKGKHQTGNHEQPVPPLEEPPQEQCKREDAGE